MRQRGITIIKEIQPDKVEALKILLNGIGDDIDGNGLINFYQLRSVHFMRWVVLDADSAWGKPTPPQLVLATNFDGNLDVHLNEMVTKGGRGLKMIYAHCIGFQEVKTSKAFIDYLKQGKRRNAAFYTGTMGRTVTQVHREGELRNGIQDFLQESNPSQDWSGQSLRDIRRDICSGIFENPKFNWVLKRHRRPFLQRFGIPMVLASLFLLLAGYVVAWIFAPLPTAILTAFFALVIGIWAFRLRKLEQADAAAFIPQPKAPDKVELTNSRHYRVQKQLTHLVEIKPGFLRQATLRFVLGAIGLLARTVYNQGQLGGISTIHYARWNIIDNGRRLLFFTNFDGSWENYLGDFVDRAPLGLTGVWSNTVEFPPTRKLVYDGATNSTQFKAWAHNKEIEAQVWYSGYKYMTVANIQTNTRIRRGLIGHISNQKIEEWLQSL